MKRFSLLMIMIVLVLMINGLAFAGVTSFDDGDIDHQTSGYQMVEAVVYGDIIEALSTKVVDIYNLAGYSSLAVHNLSVSSGNITLEYQSYNHRGNLLSTASMTVENDITNFHGANGKIVLTNSVAIPVTVTFSVLLAD